MVSEQGKRSYAVVVTAEEDSGEEASPEQRPTPAVPVAPVESQYNSMVNEFENPLFLHITENSSAILVNPPLSEDNYASWSRAMKMALEVKNKFGLVDGSIPIPETDDPRFHHWKRCNTMVCSWILKSVSPMIAESIMYLEITRDIWKDLHSRFSQSDPHRIAELKNQIYNTKQGTMSVNAYFTKCKSLWEQISMLRHLPMCECNPRFSCTLVSKIRKEREDDRVIRFLDGLNDDYENVKSNVLVLDPIPPIDKVFNMALKMERKLNANPNSNINELIHANAAQNSQAQGSDEDNVVAVTGSNNSNGYFNKKKFGGNGKNVHKCTHCGMNGHTVDKCYKKHGYPSGWIPGYKAKARQNGNFQQGINASMAQIGDTGITSDQLQKLLAFLQTQNGQSFSPTPTAAAAFTVNSSPLKSNFKPVQEEPNEGFSWDDSWFC